MQDLKDIEKRLWETADQLRTNSGLRPSEYARPVLGLLFLRFADRRFARVEAELKPKEGSRIVPGRDEFRARGAIWLEPGSRYEVLRTQVEGADLGQALNGAMKQIERDNPDLEGALPTSFADVSRDTLIELIRLLEPLDLSGDAFGQIYEYFMGAFTTRPAAPVACSPIRRISCPAIRKTPAVRCPSTGRNTPRKPCG